jgi:phage terminase large subunit
VGYVQFIRGELRVIDYSCERGRGAPYHAEQVEAKPYVYAEHHMPHDVMNHEKGTGIVLKDVYSSLLKAPIRTVKRPKLKIDSITALCDIFNMIRFNARTCCVEVKDQPEKNLVKAAAYYRYQWDEDSKTYSKDPVDDWAADPADMLQTLAMEYRYGKISGERIGSPIPVAANLRSNADPYGGWHVLDGVRKRRS